MTPSPDFKPPKIVTWLVFLALVNGVLLLLFLLPFQPAAALVMIGVVGAVVFAARRSGMNLREAWQVARRWSKRAIFGLPVINHFTPISLVLAAVEVGILVGVAVHVTGEEHYIDFNNGRRLRGIESEWLTSSLYYAADGLREYGYIPKWQTWLEWGEPVVNNPFSFLYNPISSLPGLLFGAVEGIRISVTLYAVVAATGGWFLARVLGCGSLARVLLGLLLLGKGNMHAALGLGYYQLAMSQAYFGWVIGAVLAVLWMPGKRWTIVLLALAITLMFFAGNIWYMLPILFNVGLLALVYGGIVPGRIARAVWARLALAGIMTLGLSMTLLLPVWAERDHIGDHPNEIAAGSVVPIRQVVGLFFTDDMYRMIPIEKRPGDFARMSLHSLANFYYSYTIPLWFAALVLVYLPPLPRLLSRSGPVDRRGVWASGLLMAFITLIWGAGGDPIFIWLYEHMPLLGQWRFVGRALAVTSFWIAVLLALRVDNLWRALLPTLPHRWPALKALRYAAAVFLMGACALAMYQTNRDWGLVPTFDLPAYRDRICLAWLRAKVPDRPLMVFRGGYDSVYPFLDYKVRLFNIEADFTPLPLPNTLGSVMLTGYKSLPEYAMPYVRNERRYFGKQGYHPVAGTKLITEAHCLWHKSGVFSYAYTLDVEALLDAEGEMLDPALSTPVYDFTRYPDDIALVVQADSVREQVLTVQELAYPGWRVTLDGHPAPLDVVGGQIAVRLPADGQTHTVQFSFRPTLLYVGSAITLLSCALCVAYLLGWRPRWRVKG